MDYKYIEQLLERYWACETTLQEESILRSFFSQEDIPAELCQYKALFDYEQQKDDVLGDDFDNRILEMIGEEEKPKAKVVTLTSRLMPLFKAAAIVAIILTLGNAMQVALNQPDPNTNIAEGTQVEEMKKGESVAIADTMRQDSMKITEVPFIK